MNTSARRVVAVLFADGDREAHLVELLHDEALEPRHFGLLLGVVARELCEARHFGIDALLGRSKRLEITLIAGDDVAALTGFGFGGRGQDLFEGALHLLAVGDAFSGGIELYRIPVRERRVRHDYGDNHSDAQRIFLLERSVHSAS